MTSRPPSTTEAAKDDEGFLLARLAGGDLDAFRTLADRHLARALQLARRLLGDAVMAEDIVQEAMLRLWRSGGRIDEARGGLKPWLMRVVTNLCIDNRRAGGRLVTVDTLPEVAVAPCQDTALHSQDLERRVEEALARLPERQRQALTLFHYEEWSQAEIGQTMGLTADAVESLIARGRRSMKATLADDWRELLEDTET